MDRTLQQILQEMIMMVKELEELRAENQQLKSALKAHAEAKDAQANG